MSDHENPDPFEQVPLYLSRRKLAQLTEWNGGEPFDQSTVNQLFQWLNAYGVTGEHIWHIPRYHDREKYRALNAERTYAQLPTPDHTSPPSASHPKSSGSRLRRLWQSLFGG